MNKRLLTLSVAIGVALSGMVQAADVIPVNFDGPDEGYNATTPRAPEGGNPGTTIGQQRQIVAQFGADLWGAILVSDVPIFVGAQFNPLAPNVLGSAGAASVWESDPSFPFQGTWYSSALADALSGVDQDPGFTDLNSQFSSEFNFYYGLDGNTPAGQTNFLDVIVHEFGHGLGFQNFENESTGAFFLGLPDVYSQFTFDLTQGLFWPQMTQAQRAASGINYGNVVFTGANAKHGAGLVLGPRTVFSVTTGVLAGEYDYGTASFGATPTPANFNGTAVVGFDEANAAGPSTTDGCTAITADVAGKFAIVDRGTCGFAVKAANAQAAGAIGLIVANNAVANPPPAMGGTDPAVTIPAISVTQAVGATFKSNAPFNVAFSVDNNRLQGADDQGRRPRLFMPNPVQSGSSGSHYDTAASPNLVMEPAITDSLHAGLFIDMTAALLKDTGWKLNEGNAKINGCDTGIKVIDDAGFIIGANVHATSNLFLATSPDKATYQARMSAYKDKLVADGLINGKQGGKLAACAAKVTKVPAE